MVTIVCRHWRHKAAIVRQLTRVALPGFVTRASLVLVITTDLAYLGGKSSQDVAAYGLGWTPILPLVLATTAFLNPISVLTAEKSADPDRANHVWRIAIGFALLVGFILAAGAQAGQPILVLAGYGPELAAPAAGVLAILALGIPGLLAFQATALSLEARGRPIVPAVASVFLLAANTGLNPFAAQIALIGPAAPAAEHVAAITSALRWIAFLGLLLIAWLSFPRPGATRSRTGPVIRRFTGLGLPIASTQIAETGAFAVMGAFAARLSIDEAAAYSVGINVMAIAFMFALALSTSTSLASARLASPGGARRLPATAATAITVAVGFLIVIGSMLATWRAGLAAAYVADHDARNLVADLLLIVAAVVVLDGLHPVLAGFLRGLGIVWVSFFATVGSFWAVALPLGFVAAFVWQWDVAGLFVGYLTGATVCTAALAAAVLHVLWTRQR